jgi:hypothetical protein
LGTPERQAEGYCGLCYRCGCNPSGWRDQMAFCIGRREFITLFGGAAVWPLAVQR